MDEKCGYKTPTPADSLEQQIIDPSFPKNEREWWAAEEITRLRAEVEALRGITPELPPRPPEGEGLPRYGLRHNGQSLSMSVPMADGYWTPYHLAIAEVEALRADAERWRYINERNGEWRRFEADGPDPAYSMLCVRLPYDADLSCRATREIAIDAARAARRAPEGGK